MILSLLLLLLQTPLLRSPKTSSSQPFLSVATPSMELGTILRRMPVQMIKACFLPLPQRLPWLHLAKAMALMMM
jgi:hypothetical protein